ncbi:MAG: energy-coupling factor transporter ATPase [Anaerolineaceae bacterium]|nr:energy-coupling factor transporter ATPase [Anaerolineaceae bacterium]
MKSLIEVDQVTFAHPSSESSQPTLKNISLKIEQGEFVAVIGSNGSGKTTLARHLNALYVPNSGSVQIMGVDTRERNQRYLIREKIGMVFQFPEDQIVAATVEEDVAFGPENLGLEPEEIHKRVRESLEIVDMWDYRFRSPYQLSAGQIQRVALAGVLAMRPQCIIFDEATAMLDPAGRKQVNQLVQELNQQGITIILITHFMEEATQADRVIVMHAGKLVQDASPAIVFSNENKLKDLGLSLPEVTSLAKAMKGWIPEVNDKALSWEDFERSLPGYSGKINETESLQYEQSNKIQDLEIVVKDLTYSYLKDSRLSQKALDKVSLQVPKGKVQALVGSTGSGKSTILQHLNALLLPQEGEVYIGGHAIHQADVNIKAVRRYAGLVFQNPEHQFFEQFVGDEIAYAVRMQGLDRKAIRERVEWAMDMVGLSFELFKDRFTQALSGGESRKVALASTLIMQSEVLLLDEPTAGLDPRTKDEIIKKLHELNLASVTMVLSSHQMDLVAALADGVTVLQNGQVKMDASREDIFSKAEPLESLGLQLPTIAKIKILLRRLGWPIGSGVFTQQDLIDVLERISGDQGYE